MCRWLFKIVSKVVEISAYASVLENVTWWQTFERKTSLQSFQVSRFGGRSPDFWYSKYNLPISRFGMKISRFITRDSRLALSIANFAIAVGDTTFSLAHDVWLKTVCQFGWRNFYTLCDWKKQRCLTPQEEAFIETPYAPLHALKSLWSLSFVLRVTSINPFIGYPSQRERGLSRDPPSWFM